MTFSEQRDLQNQKSLAADLKARHTAGDLACPHAAVYRFLAVAFVIFVFFVLRKPDSLLNAQFWAEDGAIYFSQALVTGPSSIFIPYNSCLWIVPRLFAIAVTLLPVLWAPFAFNVIALVISAGCCALFSLPAYRHLVRSDWLRIGSCVLFAIALPAGIEMIGNLTNMPWYLALAAVAGVTLQSESVGKVPRRGILMIAAGAALCATSSPVVIAVAPLALWQAQNAIRHRNWKMLGIAAALLSGILIQVLVNFTFLGRTGHATAALIPNLPLALVFQGILRLILGENSARFLAEHFMWPAAVIASVLVIAWLGLLLRRLRPSLLLSAVLLLVGPVAMSIVARHSVWATWTQVVEWNGVRYFFLPGCAFIFLAAAGIDSFRGSGFSRLLVLLLPFTFGIAGNFRVASYPDFKWPSEAHRVRRWLATGCEVSVPIPPNWAIRLPNLASLQDSPCGSPEERPAAGSNEGVVSIDARISGGSQFILYCNDVWSAPQRLTVIAGEWKTYQFMVPPTLRSLRFDPTELSGANVEIRSVKFEYPGQPPRWMPLTDLPKWLMYNSTVDFDRSTNLVRIHATDANMYIMSTVNASYYSLEQPK